MPVTPTTDFSLPMARLAELLAASSYFRAEVDVGTPTEAAAHIYWPYASDREVSGVMENPRPRAIISHGPMHVREKLRTAWGTLKGTLFLSFEFLPSPSDAGVQRNELLRFMETVGLILRQLEEKAAFTKAAGETIYTDSGSTHLNIERYELVDGPAECIAGEHDQERFYGVSLLIHHCG